MGQELKDFVSGFSSGYKLATPTEGELKAKQERDRQDAISKLAENDQSAVPGRLGVAPHLYKTGDDGSGTGSGTGSGKVGRSLPVFATDLGEMAPYAQSISKVESGGRYDALGPKTKTGDRAYGRYQVMGANIPKWTQKYLGRSMTPDEFLKDPEAQDKVFAGEFGSYIKKYGNPADAASVWHSGRPLATAARLGLSDGNMKTTDYAKAVVGSLPRSASSAPAVQPALPPTAVNAAPAPIQGIPMPAPGGRTMVLPGAQAEADQGDTYNPGDDNQPTQLAADGGAIMPVMQMPPDDQMQDAAPPLPPRRPSDAELQVDPQINSQPDYHRIAGTHEAIDAGMGAISRDLENPDAALPQAGSDYHGRVAAFHRGDDAATPQEIRQIDQTIDPDNRLVADAKAVARLNAGYKYFLMQGDPDRAEKYAKSILGYTKQAVKYYGAQAEQKLRAGDIAGAAEDIQKGHNEVPNGASLYIDKVDPKTGKVDYRVLDEDGDLTERGQAYANQLMSVATGMQNGSEWLNQIAQGRQNSLTAAQKAAEKRRAADEGAANSFYGGSDMDLINKMSPEARKGFDAASPALKRQMLADLANRENAARAQTKDDQKQAYYQRKQDLADTKAQDQQDYAGHAAAIENARDALIAQRNDDPYDTEKMQAAQAAYDKALSDARAWAGAGPNRAAFVPQLERLGKSGGGVGGGAAGGTGGGGKGGTKDERNIAGLDRQYTMFEKAAQREKDPERQKQLMAALPHQKAQIEFAKHDTGFDDKITPDVEAQASRIIGLKEGAEPDDKQSTQLNEYQNAIRGILQGDNDLTPKQAADLAKLAVKTGKINLDNGLYSINGSDPIRMSPRAVSSLARLVKMNKPAEQPTATTRNPFSPDRPSSIPTPDEADTANARAQRVQARQEDAAPRRRRDKSAEYDQLRSQIDDSTFERMKQLSGSTDGRVPLAYLRRVVREQAGKRARVVDPDPNMP
jgi:hypothetical protein